MIKLNYCQVKNIQVKLNGGLIEVYEANNWIFIESCYVIDNLVESSGGLIALQG